MHRQLRHWLKGERGQGLQFAPGTGSRGRENSLLLTVPWRSRPILLLIFLGFVLVGSIVGGTWQLLWSLRDRAISVSERELQNLAFVLAEQGDRSFQAVEIVQQGLIEQIHKRGIVSDEEFERQLSLHEVHSLLREKVTGLPHVDGIALIDAQGKLVNSSRHWPIPTIHIFNRDYFQALLREEQLHSFVSAPEYHPGTESWNVHLARKISSARSGKLIGVVLGTIRLQYFEELFRKVAFGGDSAISLFRRDGVLLVRYPGRDSPGRSYREGPLFSKVLSGADHGIVRSSSIIDKEERLIAGHSLAHYPVVAAVATTTNSALTEWRRVALTMASATVLLIVVIATILFLCGQQIIRRLRRQYDRLDTAFGNMSQGVVMFDASCRLVVCNDRYRQMYNLPTGSVQRGCTVLDLLNQRIAAGTFSGNPKEYIESLLSKITQGKTYGSLIELGDGRVISLVNHPMREGGWVATHEDITERRRSEQELDRARKFLHAIVENVPTALMVKDAKDHRYVLVNREGEEFFGLDRGQMIGRNVYDLYEKDQADAIEARDTEALGSGSQHFFGEHVVQTPRKGPRIVTTKRVTIMDDDGRPEYLLGVIEDVTERRQAQDRIAYLAHHDALTNLPNRVLLRERLDHALSRVQEGKKLALFYLDLDHFKRINDTFGHAAGDEVLKTVAERLRHCIRDIDTVARLGGDEFAIIQAGVETTSQCELLAQEVREAIKAPCDFNGYSLATDVSIGISVALEDGLGADEILKRADTALYGAKIAGRGAHRFFDADMNILKSARHALETDLQKGLSNGEFELHYQPLVNLESNEICGVEALMRWHHPERGLISPGEFIPIAEETGLIAQLGEWSLRQACADAAKLPANVKIAVNLSPAQLTRKNFVQFVVNTLAASGMAPARLEFEITESVLLQNTFTTLATLHQLRQLGVRIAMDDFGTGYSSLSYLRSFPFDKIKIDRSFISDLSDKEESLSIVRAVIGLARSFNMATTAEGVETQQQLERVRQLGCTEMQGYLFSRPKPLAELSQLFRTSDEKAA